MGNTQGIPNAHIRIYQNLIQIRDPAKRAEMAKTLLVGAEYIQSARRMGVYSHLLQYISKVQAGEAPGYLPGEVAVPMPVVRSSSSVPPKPAAIGAYQNQLVVSQGYLQSGGGGTSIKTSTQRLVKPRSKEKALTYFQSCLEVLGLEEEVALTEDALKAAYKSAALRSHPDKKGGSEEAFEAVTRAYAYLTEILRRIHGGRTKESKVEAPNALAETRKEDAKAWQHVEPVRLNPKKLDMDAFNKMFEATRPPDPDDDGYGDWLTSKQEESGVGPKFGGKFNRDVFNKMFEEQAAAKGGRQQQQNQLTLTQPQALIMAPNSGVELGREKASSFTAAANASLKYTDLKQAYTTENTLSPQIAGVRVEQRDIKQYKAAREKAPVPLSDEELAAIAASERYAAEKERQRQLRVAQEDAFSNEYFNRMKRLVLTDQQSK